MVQLHVCVKAALMCQSRKEKGGGFRKLVLTELLKLRGVPHSLILVCQYCKLEPQLH